MFGVLCGVCSDTELGGVTQLSSLHPRGECRGVVRGCPAVLCQPLGLAEELRSSPSSFLGSLLQLSGALMPCLAPCQNTACAWAPGPLAADLPCHAQGKPPASLHPWFLCPCPQAPCSPCARPLFLERGVAWGLPAAPWHGHCPSHAKPLCSWRTGAMYASPEVSHSQARVRLVLCWVGETRWSGSAPGTPQYAPVMLVRMG